MAAPININDPLTGEQVRVIENQALKIVSDFNDTNDKSFIVELGYNNLNELVRITRKHGSEVFYRVVSDSSYLGTSTVVRTKAFGGWDNAGL